MKIELIPNVHYDSDLSYEEQSPEAVEYFENIMTGNASNIEYDPFNRPLNMYFMCGETGLQVKIISIYINQNYNWNLREQIKKII